MIAHRVIHRLRDEEPDVALRCEPDLVENPLYPCARPWLEQCPVEVPMELPERRRIVIVATASSVSSACSTASTCSDVIARPNAESPRTR